MKKFILFLFFLLLVGCDKKETPILEPVDIIDSSKESLAVLQVTSLMQEAEQKWILGEYSSCISVQELSNSISASGSFCIEQDTIVAKDVSYDGYLCSGKKSEIKCVGESSD